MVSEGPVNSNDASRWKSEVLDQIFMALAANEDLVQCLVFKGARVLNVLLGGGRQSLDLDSNLRKSFVEELPDRNQQQAFLERQLFRAIQSHFEEQDPIRFELKNVTVRSHPPKNHPMGWDAFQVKLSVEDLTKAGVRGFPGIEIDIAAPEELLESSIAELHIGNYQAYAYTLERIAGEKLRAFLSSLPTYRAKFKKPGDSVRAKDLYDLTRILKTKPIDQIEFWNLVGLEFYTSCRSRFIDCKGLPTFTEAWATTADAYSKDSTIPSGEVSIDAAHTSLTVIVCFLVNRGIIPFTFPVPAPS